MTGIASCLKYMIQTDFFCNFVFHYKFQDCKGTPLPLVEMANQVTLVSEVTNVPILEHQISIDFSKL